MNIQYRDNCTENGNLIYSENKKSIDSCNKTINDFDISRYHDLSTLKNVYSPRLRLGEYYIFSG